MQFDQVYGQQVAKQHLLDALKNGRIPHAQLFVGPEGCGALPLAIAYCRAIVEHIKDGVWSEGPHTDASLKFEKLIHPDLHFSFPVNKTNSITSRHPISDDFLHLWREAVSEQPYMSLNGWYNHIGLLKSQGNISVHESSNIMKKLALKPFESDYKFMIVWMAERINQAASNKLLKLLEEPPEKTIFILIAESTEQILPTILSRCQLVQLTSLDLLSMQAALKQQTDLSDKDLQPIIRLSEGNLIKALNIAKHDKDVAFNEENFAQWMRYCFKKDMASIYGWLDDMNRLNRENIKLFLEYGLHIFRESLILNFASSDLQLMGSSENKFIKNFARYVTNDNCMEFVQAFEEALFDIGRNCNPKIVLMDVSLIVLTKIHPKK